jgi:uracil-DNA glycosylase
MTWEELIRQESAKDYHKALRAALAGEEGAYPPQEKLYRAFQLAPFEKVKAVILGQDPYHGEGQANGLAFAVDQGLSAPPSLRNIFKEVEAEYGKRPESPALENWARQGVLLLNTVLTVKKGEAMSHQGLGWQTFTDRVIAELGGGGRPLVFLLWGAQARAKKALLKPPCLALEAPHPSPLSAHRGFLGCGHFKKANAFLVQNGLEPVDWCAS